MTAQDPMVLTAQRGRVALRMVCVPMGRDLAVTLCGGDRAHIGAVAVAQARASLTPGGGTSASTSVITLPGHKEDDLARTLAARFAARMDAVVSVACGIHMDAISQGELKDILELAEELAGQALGLLTAPWKGSAPPG
jgi:gallate decarboxylase subunit D